MLPLNLQYKIKEKLSKNNNKSAFNIALGKQVKQPRNNRERSYPGPYLTRNGRIPTTMSQGPVSPPYFHSDFEGPLLKGKQTKRMKTHLKKLRNEKTTMKRDTFRLTPESYYNLNRVWNDNTGGWNYEEMNRRVKQYIAEENARVTKRRRQAAKMSAIRKMKKKKRINDIDHRALLYSVLKNKPISRFIR